MEWIATAALIALIVREYYSRAVIKRLANKLAKVEIELVRVKLANARRKSAMLKENYYSLRDKRGRFKRSNGRSTK